MSVPTLLVVFQIIVAIYFTFHISISIAKDLRKKQPVVPILEYDIELTNERHLANDFRYVTVNSKILTDWDDMPAADHVTVEGEAAHMQECSITLELGLLNYKPHLGERTFCLFRNTGWTTQVNASIEVNGETFTNSDFVSRIQPVVGFALNEPNSVIKGYLIDGSFFGTIRIFDKQNGYHIHFYVEPIQNVMYYTKRYMDEKFFKERTDNAILFEYIGHEDQFGVVLPPDHVTRPVHPPANNKSAARNETTRKSAQVAYSFKHFKPASKKQTTAVSGKVGDGAPVANQDNGTKSESTQPDTSLTPGIPQKAGDGASSVVVVSQDNGNKSESTQPDASLNNQTSSGEPQSSGTQSNVSMPDPDSKPNSSHNDPDPSGVPSNRKRRETVQVSLDYVSDTLLSQNNEDVVGVVESKVVKSATIFDASSDSSLICNLCVWIQPHFAEKFSYQKGHLYGVAEVIEMLMMMDWLYRSMDFNSDGVADNLGFKITSVEVSNDMEIKLTEEALHSLKKMSKNYNARTNSSRRKRSESTQNQFQQDFDYYNLIFGSPDTDDVLPVDSQHTENVTDADGVGVYLDPTEFLDVEDVPGATVDRSRSIYSMSPKEAYNAILQQLHKTEFADCCAVVAFVYHNLAPALSASVHQGICSDKNLVVVSGLVHMHKIGQFDILRGLMHAFGHMLGASHDQTMKSKCQEKELSRYLNPFIMHPVQQINVGLRDNSAKMSPCAKLEIAAFLGSSNAQCLRAESDKFCGNGILDSGEDCDCGSLWQCQELDHCCGERDTVFGCKIINFGNSACSRPEIW